jgi:hypothetical protein
MWYTWYFRLRANSGKVFITLWIYESCVLSDLRLQIVTAGFTVSNNRLCIHRYHRSFQLPVNSFEETNFTCRSSSYRKVGSAYLPTKRYFHGWEDPTLSLIVRIQSGAARQSAWHFKNQSHHNIQFINLERPTHEMLSLLTSIASTEHCALETPPDLPHLAPAHLSSGFCRNGIIHHPLGADGMLSSRGRCRIWVIDRRTVWL